MMEKISVKGSNASPLFKYLKHESPGILGTEAIKWNFTKFLVNKDGEVVKRFAPKDGGDSIEERIIKDNLVFFMESHPDQECRGR